MMNFLAASGIILIFFISAYGWGRLACKYLYTEPTQSIAYDASLGLAVWVFIGGILNALGLAYSLALDIIFILGILFFGVTVIWQKYERKNAWQRSQNNPGHIAEKGRFSKILAEAIPFLLVAAAAAFLISTTLPSQNFNYHDDFYKYFPRLFRMLQSGIVGGTPFDSIGIDSLGAQAFLQSFVVAHFPLEYINGFDAVFCFLLGGLLLNDIGRRANLHWLFRSSAILAYIIINPQYVNISALYSGSLMIFALLYASLLLFECFEKEGEREKILASLSFALIAATVMGLKHTFIPFAITYFFVFFLLLVLFAEPRKSAGLIAGIAATATGVFLFPWLWVILGKINIFHLMVASKMGLNSGSQGYSDLSSSAWGKLLTLQRVSYGGRAIDYSLIVLSGLVFAAWAGFLLMRKKKRAETGNLVMVAAAGIATIIAYLVNAYLAREFDVGIRYTCPIILGTIPAVALLFPGNRGLPESGPGNCLMEARQIAVILILGMGIGIFLNGWFWRVKQLSENRVMLSYPIDKKYIEHMRNSFSNSEQEIVRSMQMRTEENSVILAWFDTPFLLDFNRNKVFTVGVPGVIMKNSKAADDDKLGSYLKSLGVDYIIWQYSGMPKQMSGARDWLEKEFSSLRRERKSVYDDGRRVVIDINKVQYDQY